MDKRKIFGLVQAIRRDSDLYNDTSTTSNTTSLRRPNTYSSRLPIPESFTNSRLRRQSIIGTLKPSTSQTYINTTDATNTAAAAAAANNTSTAPSSPHPQQRYHTTTLARNRTMSDAPRPDFSSYQRKDRRQELRRSLYLDNINSEHDEDIIYKTSAPLLDAYGIPTTVTKKPNQKVVGLLPPSDLNQKIRVCVRKRPLNRKELEKGEKDVAPTIGTRSLQINEPKLRLDLTKYTEQHSFTFDDVFDSDCPNDSVYQRTALPLVHYIFKGGKATCFAYGQTGSGKTFTMLDPNHGLYILAAQDIFNMLRKPENNYLTAWIGLYEIYQGQLYDLLNDRKKLFAREDGKKNVIISGLREYPIDNVDKLIQVFEYGSSVRSTGSTGANDSSSRSHAVLQILLKHANNRKKIHGKLCFIDLAGSERGADRGEADTKTRMEGAEINKSLLALKECIRALDQDKKHTPFRQSKLTQVLKDSFVGNSRTCMIATISPNGSNSEHTLNTLRYADRVKELKGEKDRRHLSPTERNSSGSGNSVPEEEDDNDNDDDDEYFSNESDILDEDAFTNEENLFDIDFPHEQNPLIRSTFSSNNNNLSQKTRLSPSPPSSPRYETLSYKQSKKSYDNNNETSSRPLSLQQNRQSYTLPRSFSMYASLDESKHTSQSWKQQEESIKKNDFPLLPSFSLNKMDELVRFHRAEIHEMADCNKQEIQLVTSITLDLTTSSTDKEQKNLQFFQYLQDLDELLERKLAAIEALRDRISDAVGQIDI
ncbi:P-loop containing nucleoside triphosphate hydrolase protein [Cokeromyces recurvatus]|uniref:P-loop containing nucleoside triphosphate hydrolase protein n=1 Tax=Cokeromyces recurvatus TaxID=90255 RepID=UPI00221F82F4|nr:P-loop containing nucleoside triphosphate hydrolase protein [Cokeromyces recurvatus]KAI7905288.1 P-loop containing nucleoside triphosphate hydrolase protein [Cokeromyces recurvatus]